MTDHPRKGTVAAPGSPDFALHTLGWRAFQDLCATVLREVWAQSVHTFADSNDGGRDGAFYGTWQQPPDPIGVQDVPDGPFVLQCKHTKKADTTLTPSELSDEFDKVQALVERGLCGSYVLLTNARVSGVSEATIRQRLLDAGVAYPLILDGRWICDTIATRQRLRTFVPRVYGLGDLSQILDERAYTQAQYLLSYLREELATFVVTDAYRRAAQAVQQHGFVLLLGEPAVGKSVIAATLAMTALDAWGCLTVNAHDAAELVRHWNPNEPDQFFWVDDAFGAVRHEPQLTDNWSRHMRQVMTAVHGGAKIVLTSRDYIYRDARPHLKEYAYPLLHEQQVVVDVAQLPPEERRQILYNHINLGDQPAEVRGKMKPHLEEAAAQDPADSISGCELPGQWACEAFSHGLDWGLVSEHDARSAVELMGDGAKVLCGVDGEVGALGKVLPQQAIHVLVGAALPRRVRVAEVDPEAGEGLDVLVECEFAPLVPGEGPLHLGWDVRGLCDQRVADLRGLPTGGQVDQMDVASGAFDQGADRGALSAADDQVAFPVPGSSAVVDLDGALVDQRHILDLVQGRHSATLLLTSGSAGTELGDATAEEAGEQGPVDRLRACPH